MSKIDHKPTAVPKEWEFYLCSVGDSKASIFLNMYFQNTGPFNTHNFLHLCLIQITDPGEHGLGTSSDAEVLGSYEDDIHQKALKADLYFAGRVRTNSI